MGQPDPSLQAVDSPDRAQGRGKGNKWMQRPLTEGVFSDIIAFEQLLNY